MIDIRPVAETQFELTRHLAAWMTEAFERTGCKQEPWHTFVETSGALKEEIVEASDRAAAAATELAARAGEAGLEDSLRQMARFASAVKQAATVELDWELACGGPENAAVAAWEEAEAIRLAMKEARAAIEEASAAFPGCARTAEALASLGPSRFHFYEALYAFQEAARSWAAEIGIDPGLPKIPEPARPDPETGFYDDPRTAWRLPAQQIKDTKGGEKTLHARIKILGGGEPFLEWRFADGTFDFGDVYETLEEAKADLQMRYGIDPGKWEPVNPHTR